MAHTCSSARSTATTGNGAAPPRGFTIIELIITVAVVAILASIAVPSYSGAMLRVNRLAAEQFMIDIANKEEQAALARNGFVTRIGPSGLGLVPSANLAANYTFAVALSGADCMGNSVSGAAYVITATAIGAQVPDGNLCLDSGNHRGPSGKWGS
jgi:type IV pilus assembly protein PilE